ncbi:MAG: hypothetical protein FJ284_10955 [Planctomycetes bacterium]|nr:hypothetical protein [Planctomycetota bacterium]
MRSLFMLVAIIVSMFIASVASASQTRAANPQVRGQRNGPVAKLVELERRKNEWLRQRFAR